ncbi:hypothetical protein KGQ71_03210 [Patescibacteria group bacterium]|nr:hypothetical protein [Patescibacteria group bacterium]
MFDAAPTSGTIGASTLSAPTVEAAPPFADPSTAFKTNDGFGETATKFFNGPSGSEQALVPALDFQALTPTDTYRAPEPSSVESRPVSVEDRGLSSDPVVDNQLNRLFAPQEAADLSAESAPESFGNRYLALGRETSALAGLREVSESGLLRQTAAEEYSRIPKFIKAWEASRPSDQPVDTAVISETPEQISAPVRENPVNIPDAEPLPADPPIAPSGVTNGATQLEVPIGDDEPVAMPAAETVMELAGGPLASTQTATAPANQTVLENAESSPNPAVKSSPESLPTEVKQMLSPDAQALYTQFEVEQQTGSTESPAAPTAEPIPVAVESDVLQIEQKPERPVASLLTSTDSAAVLAEHMKGVVSYLVQVLRERSRGNNNKQSVGDYHDPAGEDGGPIQISYSSLETIQQIATALDYALRQKEIARELKAAEGDIRRFESGIKDRYPQTEVRYAEMPSPPHWVDPVQTNNGLIAQTEMSVQIDPTGKTIITFKPLNKQADGHESTERVPDQSVSPSTTGQTGVATE